MNTLKRLTTSFRRALPPESGFQDQNQDALPDQHPTAARMRDAERDVRWMPLPASAPPCRWIALLLAVIVLLLPVLTFAQEPDAQLRLNVLFIAVDDLRPELGIYGRPVHSPHIDRLGRSGTVFEKAYCQQALCMPSRASLLTGRRPDTTKVYAFQRDFRDALPDVVTLPQYFKAHGFHTQAFGKIFHKDDPASWSEALRPSTKARYHTQQGKDVLRYIKEDFRRIQFTWHLGEGITKTKRMGGLPWEAPAVEDDALRDGDNTNRAIATLKRLKDKPFFLAVGYHKPHLPFIAPKKYFDLYDHDRIPIAPNPTPPDDVPQCALYNWNDMRHYYGVPKVGPVSDAMARNLIHAYFACVSYIDAQVGRLLDALDALGLKDNTVIILWGDHGWQLGEHGMWDKHSNFETSTHVPMILHVPGQTPARTQALVEFVDIYPTLAELCGLPAPMGVEGDSFAPLLQNPAHPWKSAAFSQYPRVIPGYGRGMGHSIRTQHYRFTEWTVEGTDFKAYELYDHTLDPGENVNVVNDPKYAARGAELKRQLHAGWKKARPIF